MIFRGTILLQGVDLRPTERGGGTIFVCCFVCDENRKRALREGSFRITGLCCVNHQKTPTPPAALSIIIERSGFNKVFCRGMPSPGAKQPVAVCSAPTEAERRPEPASCLSPPFQAGREHIYESKYYLAPQRPCVML